MAEKKRCEKCERTFKSKQALKDHVRDTPGHGERCRLCGRTFRSVDALKQHMDFTHVHIMDDTSLATPTLVAQGASQANEFLERDIEKISQSTPSTAPSGQFSTEDERFVVCSKCERHFVTAIALDDHVRDKHGAFACDQCDSCFRTETGLADHCKSKHRRLDCSDCQRSFRTKEGLDDHIETKHPQLECPKCAKAFFTNESRSQHVKYVHGANDCPLCARSFRSQLALEQHQLAKHSKKELVRQGEPQEAGFVMVHGTLMPVVIAKYDRVTQRFYETAPGNDTVGMEGDCFAEPP